MKQRRLVLVFGARGYLGRHLIAGLVDRNISVTGVARPNSKNDSDWISLDTRIRSRLDAYLSKNHIEGVDICILIGSSREREGREIHESNFVVNKKIVDLASDLPDPRIIYVGGLGIPIENNRSSESYYFSKAKIIQYISDSPLECKTIINPSYIVGEDDEFSHVIQAFENGSTIYFPEDGKYQIQPIYIDDFTNLLCSIIQDETVSWNGSWDVAGEPVTYRRFLETIRDGVIPSVRVLPKPLIDYLRDSLFLNKPTLSSSEISILVANFVAPYTKTVNGVDFRSWNEISKLLIRDYSKRFSHE